MIFTVESLREYWVEDYELFNEIVGVNIEDYKGSEILSLTKETVKELQEKGAFKK